MKSNLCYQHGLKLLIKLSECPQYLICTWRFIYLVNLKFLFDSSNIEGYCMNNMHSYFQFFILISLCLLLWGCEKPGTANSLSEVEEKEPVPVAPQPVSAVSAPEPLPEKKTAKEAVEIAEEIPLPEKKSAPVQPPFSDELLRAVQNWQMIPKSVFPLKAISLYRKVDLEAKTSSGKVIATSVADIGEEVTALGIDQGKLVVASPNMVKLRGIVELDQTDFKQMVAYLFELRKEQREKLKNRPKLTKQVDRASDATHDTQEVAEDFIPDPLDFGHGRFCICKECREKRLAQSVSLKSGHGLEP